MGLGGWVALLFLPPSLPSFSGLFFSSGSHFLQHLPPPSLFPLPYLILLEDDFFFLVMSVANREVAIAVQVGIVY